MSLNSLWLSIWKSETQDGKGTPYYYGTEIFFGRISDGTLIEIRKSYL